MKPNHPLLSSVIALILSAFSLTSCHSIDEPDANVTGIFETLWTTMDQRYCYFREKNIDWNEVGAHYRSQLSGVKNSRQLFELCSAMLNELKDGHTNLSTPFAVSYYRNWWADYPPNYNERNILDNYLHMNYRTLGAVNYGMLVENIGYLHYSSFESSLGQGNIDYILAYFAPCKALIIDVRDNTGGELSNVENWVSPFLDQRTLVGYISHKTGPGHDDFSEPYAYYYNPPTQGHLSWHKPVIVLTNRRTFSAANNFVAIMKLLPMTTVVGATTGGGGGMPFSYELPNGWGLRFSAAPITDAMGQPTEFGIEPSKGCAVDITPDDELNGRDTILDFAIDYIDKILQNP